MSVCHFFLPSPTCVCRFCPPQQIVLTGSSIDQVMLFVPDTQMDLGQLPPGLYGSCYGFGLITIEALKMLNAWCFMQQHAQLQECTPAILPCPISVCNAECFLSRWSLWLAVGWFFSQESVFLKPLDIDAIHMLVHCSREGPLNFKKKTVLKLQWFKTITSTCKKCLT